MPLVYRTVFTEGDTTIFSGLPMRPKAVEVRHAGGTASPQNNTDLLSGYGMMDDHGNQICYAVLLEDGTNVAKGYWDNAKMIRRIDNAGASVADAVFTITDTGVTAAWGASPGAVKYVATAWCSCDVSDIEVAEWTASVAAPGDQTISLSMTPTFYKLMGIGALGNGAVDEVNEAMSFNTDDDSFMRTMTKVNGTAACSKRWSAEECFRQISNSRHAAHKEFGSNSVVITWADTDADAHKIAIFAMSGPQVKVNNRATKSALGQIDYTGIPFEGRFIQFTGVSWHIADATSAGARSIFGEALSSTDRGTQGGDKATGANTNADTRWNESECYVSLTAGVPAVLERADFVDWIAGEDNGYTLDFATASVTAYRFGEVVYGDSALVPTGDVRSGSGKGMYSPRSAHPSRIFTRGLES